MVTVPKCFNCKVKDATGETRDGVPLCDECGKDLVANQPGPTLVQQSPKPTPIFDAWKSYEHEVVPRGASSVQREECRRAFYAGALAGYGLTLAACTEEEDALTERTLTELSEEINGILTDLKI